MLFATSGDQSLQLHYHPARPILLLNIVTGYHLLFLLSNTLLLPSSYLIGNNNKLLISKNPTKHDLREAYLLAVLGLRFARYSLTLRNDWRGLPSP